MKKQLLGDQEKIDDPPQDVTVCETDSKPTKKPKSKIIIGMNVWNREPRHLDLIREKFNLT